jgi:hypothetical protein
MKSSIFWDIKLYSPLTANQHFGGIRRLHLQGGRISEARNGMKKVANSVSCCFFLGLFLGRAGGGEIFFRNVG